MGIEKAEVKIGVAQEIGRQYAGKLQSLNRELEQNEGSQKAYGTAKTVLPSILQRVDDDLDAGRYENLTSLEVAKEVKAAVMRCHQSLESLTEQSKHDRFKIMGEIDGFVKASEFVEKLAKNELKKIESLAAAVEGDEVVPVDVVPVPEKPRPVGVRPGPSIAAQRKAESAQERPQPAKKVETPPASTPISPVEGLKQAGIRSTATSPRVFKSGGSAKKTSKKPISKKSPSKKKPSKKP